VQERVRRPAPPFDERLSTFRVIAPLLGVALLLLSLWLYLQPEAFLEGWPWPMTPLLGRVFAGWYIFASLLMIANGLMVRQPHEAPISNGTVALWNFLMLLLPVIYAADMRPGSSLTLWLALHLVWLAFAAWAAISTWRMMKAEGDRL
jgi:hypothetical protein